MADREAITLLDAIRSNLGGTVEEGTAYEEVRILRAIVAAESGEAATDDYERVELLRAWLAATGNVTAGTDGYEEIELLRAIAENYNAPILTGSKYETIRALEAIRDASANLITNPGFETDPSGWEGSGASIARITSDAKFGSACLEVTVGSPADLAGARRSSGEAVSAGTPYTGSLWLRASSGTPTIAISLVEYTGADAFVKTNTQTGIELNTSEWLQTSLSITTQATTGIVRVYAATFGSQTATFKVDGARLVAA